MITQTAINKPLDKLVVALSAQFPPQKVDEILIHYETLQKEAKLNRHESCLVNGGKFVEAVLKCLHYRRTGNVTDSVKVDEEIRQLENASSLNDSERMTIPRCLRAIYELRSKRGGAHNLSFEPTEMDCTQVVHASNWVMEELTRLYLTNDPVAAQTIVKNLLVKDIPLIEVIGGDYLFLKPEEPARVQLQIVLYQHYPNRCLTRDLVQWIHSHSADNIRTTLRNMKLKNLVHENEDGWILTETGIREAEAEIVRMRSGNSETKQASTVKKRGVQRGKRQRRSSR